MNTPRFDYLSPRSIDEALAVLACDAARALVGDRSAPATFEAVGRRVAERVQPDSDLTPATMAASWPPC